MSRAFIFVATGVGLLLALWLGIAFLADGQSYMKLVRSGLLLIGLGGIAWGFLLRRPWVPLMGLAFLAIGLLTCFVGPDSWGTASPSGAGWTSELADRLAQPLGRRGVLKMWHFVVIAFLGLNSALFVRRADWRRFAAANVLAFVGVWVVLFAVTRT